MIGFQQRKNRARHASFHQGHRAKDGYEYVGKLQFDSPRTVKSAGHSKKEAEAYQQR